MKHWGSIILICLAVCACSSDKKIAPSEGRLSLMEEAQLKQAQGTPRLESSKTRSVFLMADENAQNKKSPVSFKAPKKSWQAKAGSYSAPQSFNKILVDEKNISTLDKKNVFSQFDLKGNKTFEKQLDSEEVGQAITSKNGAVYILTAMGTLIKVDSKGKELWKKKFNTPFRNDPVLYKDIIYLLSASNDLWALDTKDGKEVWHYKTTTPTTTLWKMGRPAVNNNTLIVPFSNGIVMAFQAQTGAFLWETDMIGAKAFNQISQISQMTASPVIEENTLYLVGHADITKALNLKSGEEIWTLPIGGNTTPFINGNTLFLLDNQGTLHALNKSNGHQFWQKNIANSGTPSLDFINDTFVLFYPQKTIIINPKTGNIQAKFETNTKVAPPVATKDGLYFLTDNGKLNYQGFLK